MQTMNYLSVKHRIMNKRKEFHKCQNRTIKFLMLNKHDVVLIIIITITKYHIGSGYIILIYGILFNYIRSMISTKYCCKGS